MYEEEVWKAVPGYEGLYEVSNIGRVKSLDHYVNHHTAGKALRHGKVLTPCKGSGPYQMVMLSKENKHHPCRVHRLVAEAFIPNPDSLSDVDHIDCDKLNNRVENLRWCTHADNMGFAKANGRMNPKPWSERSEESRRNSSAANRRAIVRSDGKQYESTTQAAKDLGVSRGAVSHVLRGLTQTCQGYSFTYLE